MAEYKAYKFRCYPTKEQEILIHKTFGCVRFYWNQALHDNIEYYKENGKGLIKTPATYKDEYPWLKEVDSYALCYAQLNLQKAFNQFFKRKEVGFPKFKSKHNSRQSYQTTSKGIKVTEKEIKIIKLGWLKIKNHRNKVGIAKSATISYESNGCYYVSIMFEESTELDGGNGEIGLDLGLTDLVIGSNGNKVKALRPFKNNEKKLTKEQRKLSKMQRGSNNYAKQKIKVAKVHAKIKNQRKDYLNKVSYHIANENQVVCMEDLNIKGLLKNKHLAKSIYDAGWYELKILITQKVTQRGGIVISIPRFYASSQICSACGKNTGKKPLNVREFTCPYCGTHHDRDINASKNILAKGKESKEYIDYSMRVLHA